MEYPTVHALLSRVWAAAPELVGIDGFDGCRKSSLAIRLAGHLRMEVVELDSLVEKNMGSYVDFIDYDALKDALQGSRVIVEGVCLLQVLERANVEPDVLIYVKRMRNGLWAEEDELGLNEPLEDHLAKLRQSSAMLQGQEEPDETLGLGEEIIRYHHRYRPHDTADVKYVWSDS